MLVALHLGYGTKQVEGVWLEVPGGVTWEYRDESNVACLEGIEEMSACPTDMPWPDYWRRLADRISPLFWLELAEVDDEKSLYDVLWHFQACHPSDPSESVAALVG